MMTAIIIEDEQLATRELDSILRRIAPDITVTMCLESVQESIEWLEKHAVDLIFSDIHLGDGQSFEIFKRVKTEVPVIFITAYDEYALRAFKNQGIDYILKPFDEEEIRQALEKVRRWFGETTGKKVRSEDFSWQGRFLVQLGAKIVSVTADQIAYFMADGKYLFLYTHDGAKYVVDHTIGGIEGRLDPRHFFRINRKFIIHYKAIKEMIRYSNNRIKIILSPLPADGIEAIVSGERIREFKEWLNQ